MRAVIGVFLLFLFLFTACEKGQESTVPNVPVNIRISLDDPAYHDLISIGGKIVLEGGHRGIIVYHRMQDDYKAYERTCPYLSEQECAIVSIDSTISSVGCDCCKSRFQLLDGSPISGPSQAPLRSYRTSLSQGYLYITN